VSLSYVSTAPPEGQRRYGALPVMNAWAFSLQRFPAIPAGKPSVLNVTCCLKTPCAKLARHAVLHPANWPFRTDVWRDLPYPPPPGQQGGLASLTIAAPNLGDEPSSGPATMNRANSGSSPSTCRTPALI